MCDRAPTWLQYARFPEGSHPPLEPCALGLLQEGPWYGFAPTGYKLMRRVSHSERGSALDQLNKYNREPFNGGGRGSTGTQNGSRPDTIVARHALSPSTPRAFRRDPPGSGD